MNKILIALCCILFPSLLVAESSSLSFTPPLTDYSVGFLGNIFGLVDGVLHGTGSQMMGSIFTVFNAAVLALGGIIIMYTLIVGTLNTAHEGKMLGQKWSSIWIPVRSTTGLALLIPKASGYCLMQIFVMWTVVQGVGAADKVWSAALSYLNRGGTIITTSMSPATSLGADNSEIGKGGKAVLAGQVCMLAVEQRLNQIREAALKAKAAHGGPCSGTPMGKGQYSKLELPFSQFCNESVPDFLGSVNAVTFQDEKDKYGTQTTVFELPMPNFAKTDSPLYSQLNGICGYIKWNPIQQAIVTTRDVRTSNKSGSSWGKRHVHHSVETTSDLELTLPSLTEDDMKTIRASRAMAIQQMYMDYSTIAQQIVNNDPSFTDKDMTDITPLYPQAQIAFGLPFDESGNPCNGTSPTCNLWQSKTGSALLNGSDFQFGIMDYNAVMMPTLRLINQAKSGAAARRKRDFIVGAQAQGWMNAGSYFFNLIALNGDAASGQNLTDSGSGFGSSLPPSGLDVICDSGNAYLVLCKMLSGLQDTTAGAAQIANLTTLIGTPPIPSTKVVLGSGASTVQGFTSNAMLMQLPGMQPPFNPPKFVMPFNFDLDPGLANLPEQKFACGGKIIRTCIGREMGKLFYNNILRWIFNLIGSYLVEVQNAIIVACLATPLLMISVIFINGVDIIQNQNANPIVALAQMGTAYINESVTMWLTIANMIISLFMSIILVPVGFVALFTVILVSPILISWMGVMVAIGFTTSYYLPFLPYMVFTFGTIAWLMAVIEAMVAAPIVALGITHPEGEGILGKGETAIMILMNVFLRPSMMIIGYVAGIALCYVSVWIINAGFSNVLKFIQGGDTGTSWGGTGYTTWAGIYGFFFGIVIYTTMYLTVAEKAFTLIHQLPDQVLRWIGGHAEQTGQQAAGWTEPVKQKSDDAAQKTLDAQGQMGKKITGTAVEAAALGADMAAPGSGEVVKGFGKSSGASS